MRGAEDRTSLRAFVRGRVQGVGFRAFVVQEAGRLGVDGSVRNLSDGTSVEVRAEGPPASLAALVERLRAGPPGSFVAEVEQRWDEPAVSPVVRGFHIS